MSSGSARPTLVSVAYTAIGVLPVYLLSALAVELSRDLHFDQALLGVAVGVHFAVGAICANPVGRLVEQRGARVGLRVSAMLICVVLLVMALAVHRWWQLTVALAFAGIAVTVGQVSANFIVAGAVAPERRGVAFGTKEAAVPAASICTGLLLPIVALPLGWRATFAAAAAVALLGACAVPRLRLTPGSTAAAAGPDGGWRPTRMLLAIALVGMLAGAIGNSLPTFAVDAAVTYGLDQTAAGVLLAAGSASAVLVRVGVGWVVDHRSTTGISELATLTGLGGVALVLLVLAADNDTLFVVGMVVGMGAGWGWPGVMYYAVTRADPQAAGRATGFVLSGVFVGTVLGPTTIGLVAEHAGYPSAWMLGAVAFAAATAVAAVARRWRIIPSSG